jgi:hypothetical protein
MSDELKFCPFCGGRAVLKPIRDGVVVTCWRCFTEGRAEFFGPRDKPGATDRAIAAWNHRAAPEAEGNGSSNASPSAALHGANLDAEPSAAVLDKLNALLGACDRLKDDLRDLHSEVMAVPWTRSAR